MSILIFVFRTTLDFFGGTAKQIKIGQTKCRNTNTSDTQIQLYTSSLFNNQISLGSSFLFQFDNASNVFLETCLIKFGHAINIGIANL